MTWLDRQARDIANGTGQLLALVPKALFWALVACMTVLTVAFALTLGLAVGLTLGLSSLDSWLCSWGTHGKG